MKTLEILKTDMKTFLDYLRQRIQQQQAAGNIEDANITLETLKTVKSWYQDLKNFIQIDSPAATELFNELKNN